MPIQEFVRLTTHRSLLGSAYSDKEGRYRLIVTGENGPHHLSAMNQDSAAWLSLPDMRPGEEIDRDLVLKKWKQAGHPPAEVVLGLVAAGADSNPFARMDAYFDLKRMQLEVFGVSRC